MKKKPSMNQARFDAIKALLNAGVNYRTISKVMTSSSTTIKFVDQAETLDDYKRIQHDFYVVLPSRAKNYNDSPHKEQEPTPSYVPLESKLDVTDAFVSCMVND